MSRQFVRAAAIVAVLGGMALPGTALAQSAADSAAIRQAAIHYMQGWYTGDAERMRLALHPELAKRIMVTQRASGARVLQHLTAEQLVQAAGSGGGSKSPASERRAEVRILDIFRSTASVRVDMQGWIDYMHLSRMEDGRWVIVNVLWEWRATTP